MRRALWLISWSLLGLLAVRSAEAASQGVDFVNGIGLIDYASHPSMKVGSWVRYRMAGSSQMGEKDDYEVTVLIAGEERFWGEDCFWVETWTEIKGRPPRAMATLMSYDVYSDSLPSIRNQYYMRKSVDALTPDGNPMEQVVRRPASTLKKRGTLFDAAGVKLDTLGTDTVSVAGVTYSCRKISWEEGKAATLDQRDSSITTQVREKRMQFFSTKIPVTGLVREDLERSIKRKSWAIGRSSEGSPLNIMDLAMGSARVIAFGENQESRLLPKARQISLKQIDAAARPKAPARSTTAARKKS